MKSILSSSLAQILSRTLLGLVFIVASIDKISAPDAFAASIEAYHLIPSFIINLFAIIIPWIELFAGIFLISGVYLRSSAFLMCLLLAIFEIAIVSALLRGLTIDCGCFGKEHATPVSWGKAGEDLLLFVLGMIVYKYSDLSASGPTAPLESPNQ